MRYRPPSVKSEFKKGERGEAIVRISKKDKRYFLVEFSETGRRFKLLRTRSTQLLKPGKWYIQLNGNEDEIFAFRPITGTFKGKVKEFVSGEDGIPAPRTYERRNAQGKEYSVTEFTALIEIIEPEKYAKIVVPYQLRYNFREAEVDGKSVVGFPDRGSRTKQLVEFCGITGVWKFGPMKYKDNVLPGVEKRILRAEQEFMFLMKNSWIDTLFEADEPEEVEDWEEDEPTPAPAEVEDDADEEIELDWEEE